MRGQQTPEASWRVSSEVPCGRGAEAKCGYKWEIWPVTIGVLPGYRGGARAASPVMLSHLLLID